MIGRKFKVERKCYGIGSNKLVLSKDSFGNVVVTNKLFYARVKLIDLMGGC